MITTKDFDKSLYVKYDDVAKSTFVAYLQDKHGDIPIKIDPFGRYGIDVYFNVGGIDYYADMEVRGNWTNGSFPFETIHLPARKKKFLDVCTDPVMFIAFRHDLKKFIVIPGDQVRLGKIIKLNNKYMSDEDFVDIPIKNCVEVSWTG